MKTFRNFDKLLIIFLTTLVFTSVLTYDRDAYAKKWYKHFHSAGEAFKKAGEGLKKTVEGAGEVVGKSVQGKSPKKGFKKIGQGVKDTVIGTGKGLGKTVIGTGSAIGAGLDAVLDLANKELGEPFEKWLCNLFGVEVEDCYIGGRVSVDNDGNVNSPHSL